MNIVVFGGHGFLGQHLCRALGTSPQHRVTALSRQDGLDLREFSRLEQCLQDLKPEVIFNCAAHVGGVHYVSHVPADVVHDNGTMALQLYRAVARHCPTAHIVNPLSNCSYPGDKPLFVEAEWLHGDVHPSVYPYGHAKRMLYVIATCYQRQYGIRSTHFLVPNAFGPGDRTEPHMVHALNGMIIRMLHAWKNHEPEFEVWGSGRPIREWVYVEDAAAIITAALSLSEEVHEPINIAQNQGYTIHESAVMIARAIPYNGVITCNTHYQDGDPQKIMHDQRFRRFFPHFQFTDPGVAIAKTVNYYKTVLCNEQNISRMAS
ncbi:MAG TPA: NAD-dependent epimerase/dehydratase family protein [Candidatus Tectomicrobia bacterium]